jgi:sec-independent protein translocase protein TatA
MGLENPIHLLVLAVIILLVFGSSQLPKIARSAGKHAREAKEGITSFKEEFDVGLGENNPLHEVTDTLRSANPKTIAREAVSKATKPPAPARSSRPAPRPASTPKPPPAAE